MSFIQSPVEAVICASCNGKQIFKHEGNMITVYHDCYISRGKELIEMIAASIREYPNAGGDITIMAALEALLKRREK